MIKRTLEISQQPVHLAVRNDQLLLEARGDGRELLASAPCEDVGVLLVEHVATTYTHNALLALLRHGAVVVLCGPDHLPAGLLLPVSEHTEVVARLHTQLAVTKPVYKRLWQQIVRAKIRASALNLPTGSATRSKLLGLARQVRSGDPDNLEAQAARAYWSAWRDSLCGIGLQPVSSSFHRDPDGPPPNNLLNYGYAVMRAAVARAIVAAGLHPALGIHHLSRANAFCLADDLLEPLRPIVDARVRELVKGGQNELTPDCKRGLLELLTIELRASDQAGPLMVALHRFVASLVRCYEGSAEKLEIPVICEREPADADTAREGEAPAEPPPTAADLPALQDPEA